MSEQTGGFDWNRIAKGIVLAVFLTFLLLLGIAAGCYFAAASERMISGLTLAASGCGVFFGAFFAARHIGRRGLLHGAAIAGGYLLLLWISGALLRHGFTLSIHRLSVFLCVISSGMLGGILGVRETE